MKAKTWLSRAQMLDKEITALITARDKAYARCIATTNAPREIQISASHTNKVREALEAYALLEQEIDSRIDELTEIKREIIKAIGGMENPVYRTLLLERYINLRTWEDIASVMQYTERNIFYLHGAALKAFASFHSFSV